MASGHIVETRTEEACSIEISRNAKGDYSWSVKVYGDSEALEDIVRKIKAVDKNIRRRFIEDRPDVGLAAGAAEISTEKKPKTLKKKEPASRESVPSPAETIVDPPEEEGEPDELHVAFAEGFGAIEEEETPKSRKRGKK
jgi:hypothetical protein